jgi:hypothetical protein
VEHWGEAENMGDAAPLPPRRQCLDGLVPPGRRDRGVLTYEHDEHHEHDRELVESDALLP